MRIAHFTNTYHPVVTGVVRSVSTFRQSLTDLGHVVFVLAQNADDYVDTEPFIYRYPAFELPIHNKFPVTIPMSPFIDWLLPPLKLDVIHAHHPVLLGQTAAHHAEHLGVPLVFTFHTRYRDYSHYISLNQTLVKEVIDRWLGVYMRRCHHIVVPSPSIQRLLTELYGVQQGVSVLPTGIDVGPYGRADGTAVRQRHGWEQKRVLISVGRLAKEKSWDVLLNAVALVMRELDDVRLIIVGDGEEYQSLVRQARSLGIADRVELSGAVPFAQIPGYLKAADLFCFASITETQGLVTLEAMAAGLPVVAYSASGTSDVVTHEVDGLLTDNTPEALAAGISRVLEDEGLRTRLRQTAVAKAATFDVHEQAKRLVAIYEEAIEDRRNGRCIDVDIQKPLVRGKWYELLGLEKNPFRALQSSPQ